MYKTIKILTLYFLITSSVFAELVYVDLNSKIKSADLIVKVKISKILNVEKGISKRYLQVAKANVKSIIKGQEKQPDISILFDNGYLCPNVDYNASSEYILFLVKNSKGLYETVNLSGGQFPVIQKDSIRYYDEDKKKSLVVSIDQFSQLIKNKIKKK